jgi:hypothetical protein
MAIRKLEILDEADPKVDLDPTRIRLALRLRDHLRCRVDAVDRTLPADSFLGCEGQVPCAAAHVEDALAGLDDSQIDGPFSEELLATEEMDPIQDVVDSRPANPNALGLRS